MSLNSSGCFVLEWVNVNEVPKIIKSEDERKPFVTEMTIFFFPIM